MAKKTSRRKARRAEQRVVVPRPPALHTAQVAVLCAVVFLSPLLAATPATSNGIVMQCLIFAAALLWMLEALRSGTISIPGRLVSISALVFYAVLVVSAIGSSSLHNTLRELANVGSYLLLFLMVARLGSDSRSVQAVLAGIMLSAGVVGLLGVREYLEAFLMRHDWGWRIFSTFYNPDFLAGYVAMVLPVSLALLVSGRTFSVRFLSGVVAVVCAASLVFTSSRFGMAAAFFGVLVMGVLRLMTGRVERRSLLRLAIPLVAVLVVGGIFARPMIARVTSRLSSSQSHSGGFRLGTWKGTARMIAANPVNGTGLGSFEVAYPKYASLGYTTLAHNSYLQLAAEAGPAAPTSLAVLILAVLIPAGAGVLRRRTAEAEDETRAPPATEQGMLVRPASLETRTLICGLVGGASASVVRNMVDSDWYITAIGITFWAVMGALLSMGAEGTRRTVRAPKAGMSALLVLMLSALIGNAIMLAGEVSLAGGKALAQRGLVPNAKAAYETAARLMPFNSEPLRRLAVVNTALARYGNPETMYREAEGAVERAIRIEPDDAHNWYSLGLLQDRESQAGPGKAYQGAIEAYKNALRRDPNSLQSMLALAVDYDRQGMHAEALAQYRRMVELEFSPYETIRAVPEYIEPRYAFAHSALGDEAAKLGDKAAAVRHYQAALDRIKAYQAMGQGMTDALQSGGLRDTGMESRVEELRAALVRKMAALEKPTTGSS